MLPNFIVLGAPKAGTTSLYHYLNQHPDILLSYRKEILFFDSSYHKGPKWYQGYFKHHKDEAAIGDITPSYLHNPYVPKRIKRHLPDAKLLCLLRDPVGRAYSHYWDLKGWGGMDNVSFRDALLDPRMCKRGYSYIEFDILDMGMYFKHISRYLEYFNPEQIGVFFFQDMLADPNSFMQTVFRFLDVEPIELAKNGVAVHNARRTNRSKAFGNVLVSEPLRDLANLLVPGKLYPMVRRFYDLLLRSNTKRIDSEPMKDEDRRFLISQYQNDIKSLSQWCGRDLSGWLN